MKYKLDHCVGNKLRRLSRIVDQEYRVGIKDFNITENQMTVLFLLHSMGTVDQGVIGKKLYLERSSVSRNLNVLQKGGYVIKNDAYRPKVSLTPEGTELVLQLIPVWEDIMDKIVSEIGIDGVEMINELEKKLM